MVRTVHIQMALYDVIPSFVRVNDLISKSWVETKVRDGAWMGAASAPSLRKLNQQLR